MNRNFAFVDIETTGGSAFHDRIIEVGIIKVESNTVTKTYQTLINPQTYISPFIEQITGINKDMLEPAPVFEDIAYDILETIGDAILVAHNARFDYGFLKNEFRRMGIEFAPRQVCSVKLSRMLFPGHARHNLDSIIDRFGITCDQRHRALGDAQVIWHFFQKIEKLFDNNQIEICIDKLLKKPSLPAHLPMDTLDSLPELPGVYIFYGEAETPLYIGKSINIKERVLSHFNSDHTSSKEMNISQQVRRIETITTAGELGALLLESSLIKKHQPIYNRMLRETKQLCILKKIIDTNGYYSVICEYVSTFDLESIHDVYGVFKTKRQAKEFLAKCAKEHSLCTKLLQLEKTRTSCFNHKLGYCKGACVSKEVPAMYNVRFDTAFNAHRIKQWPFKGPILIGERSIEKETYDQFLLDKWCLLEQMNTAEEYINDSINMKDIKFDYDTYKILVRYVLNVKNHKNIKELYPPIPKIFTYNDSMT